MKSYKIEFYPDGVDNAGPRALVLQFHKPNSKRFNSMTKPQKKACLKEIERFESMLNYLKRSL